MGCDAGSVEDAPTYLIMEKWLNVLLVLKAVNCRLPGLQFMVMYPEDAQEILLRVVIMTT